MSSVDKSTMHRSSSEEGFYFEEMLLHEEWITLPDTSREDRTKFQSDSIPIKGLR